MKLTDLLVEDVMILDLKATTKQGAIDEMIDKLFEHKRITNEKTFKAGILAREAQSTTGLGDGIAMPHAKNKAVRKATILFAKSKKGVDYDALDGKPVHLFFMIAAPEGADDTHLAALGSLSKYLLQDGFSKKLKAAKTPQEVTKLFSTKIPTVTSAKVEKKAKDNEKFVVAVTACATGIAHTYMAEEALKKQAAKMGVDIKVETHGASGIGNPLTKADIARAEGVIVAADKAVPMARFVDKPLVNRPVKDGIREPKELIALALNPKTKLYVSTDERKSEASSEELSVGKAFYKHLMSGVSAMLPFVIGGGIVTALAFLIDQMIGVPQDQLAQLGGYHELAAVFKNIGGAAFGFMLPVLAGYIAYSIADKPGLVAGFVAGLLAGTGLAFGHVPYAAGGASSLALVGVPSGFLGALVGGFVAGGLMLILKRGFSKFPRSLDGLKSILLYPVLGVLLTGLLMLFINIPMSGINTGLETFLGSLRGANAVILGVLVAGMMAVDMGGPVNKAAYVFGTGTLASTLSSGGSEVMAAVMAGGMVPPLAVFIATVLFKNKFTKEERESGLTNIIMGLSFITEGAIPFAAADPFRAIPSFVAGSAVAGGLVAFSGLKLMAPHGGIFVIALTNNPLLYLLYVAIGSVVGGILFGLLRNNVD